MTKTLARRRELTPQQELFLGYLFDEAKGDPQKAAQLAGYSEKTNPVVIMKSLGEEIIDLAQNILAINAPRAALTLIGVLKDGGSYGANNSMKAAQDILDRVGLIKKKDDTDSGLKMPTSGGLFILPAKEIDPDMVDRLRASQPKIIQHEEEIPYEDYEDQEGEED